MCLAMSGAEPKPLDQASMQEALHHYVRAVNDCDQKAALEVTHDLWVRAPGMGPVLEARLDPKGGKCGPADPPVEVTMIARILRHATPDVVIGDGFFRTIRRPDGDRAGRIYVTFVRRETGWKLVNLRLHALEFEKPYLGVPVSEKHERPGADGWVTLFDVSSTDKFLDVSGAPFPSLWKIENGTLRAVAAPFGRSLRTKDTYRSFELRFDWKTSEKGNSGVKYRLFYLMDSRVSDGAGYEYQLADDAGDPGAIQFPVERTGALYNQFPPKGARPRPVGEWNESRLVVRGRIVEHWLNGDLVMTHECESAPPEGPILLQHHGADFWFRDLRVRRLD